MMRTMIRYIVSAAVWSADIVISVQKWDTLR